MIFVREPRSASRPNGIPKHRVKDYERRRPEQCELRVGELHLLFDQRKQDVDDRPVEEIEDVDRPSAAPRAYQA